MPRLNIYIPDDLDLELRSHPIEINVSQVCAAALRAEIAAATQERGLAWLFSSAFHGPSEIEQAVMQRFKLARCVAPPRYYRDEPTRDVVARAATRFLERTCAEGGSLAMGGGLQMWSTVRMLTQRNIGMSIWAIGAGDVDHEIPHVHPNALVTLMSLFYSERSKAMLVGAPDFDRSWRYPAVFPQAQRPQVNRVVIGSCSMFDADSPYARLLGEDITSFLEQEHVTGDFLGVFFSPDGKPVEPYPPGMTISHIAAGDLHAFSRRDDTLVALAAGGEGKVRLIRQVLEARLCNALLTDIPTANELMRLTSVPL